jgi:membrane associated rhomboid family serine protease
MAPCRRVYPNAARLSSAIRSEVLLIRSLIGINVAVSLLWWLADPDPETALRGFMVEHFLVSRAHLAAGHFWTLLSSEFSHEQPWHLALNMMVLYSFGGVLIRRWSAKTFLIFYLTAAAVASLAHVVVGLLIARDAAALGASGAVAALLAAFSVFHPRHRILVFGVIPMPAFVGALLFVAIDVWGVVAQSTGGGLPIGHGAHLGGAAFGFLYAWLKRDPAEWWPSEDEVAALIEKARAGGVDALNATERQRLEALLRQARGQ